MNMFICKKASEVEILEHLSCEVEHVINNNQQHVSSHYLKGGSPSLILPSINMTNGVIDTIIYAHSFDRSPLVRSVVKYHRLIIFGLHSCIEPITYLGDVVRFIKFIQNDGITTVRLSLSNKGSTVVSKYIDVSGTFWEDENPQLTSEQWMLEQVPYYDIQINK